MITTPIHQVVELFGNHPEARSLADMAQADVIEPREAALILDAIEDVCLKEVALLTREQIGKGNKLVEVFLPHNRDWRYDLMANLIACVE